ncbi:hypothetical protein BC834DRAFT_471574 [Gloeopeniophorella convolvens]|nr:hypothetical protein BC834DRAFT_471574 [Gloeopeniophorella convolvens]
MQWLSQNRRFYDLPETVNEKLIRMIRELAPLADESERKAFIEQQIKSAKAFTERILLDKEARDFLLVLYRVGAREWEQTKIFRASFLAKHFETGYGMVWRTAVEDMVRLVKFVFSSSAYPSIEEQQALTEAIEAGFMQQNMQSEERPVDWAKVAQRTREIEKAGLAAAAAAKLKKQERQARKKTAAAKGAASQGVEASSRSAPPRSSGGRQAKKRATEALEAGAQVKVAASKAAAPSSPKSDDGSPLESSADDDSDGSGYSPAREEVDEGSDGDEATDGDGSSGGSARPAVGFEKLTTHLVPTRQLMKWRPHPAHMKKLEAWASLIDLIDHPSALGADGQPLVSGLPALRGVWEKLDDLYADNVSPHRAYLGSMRHINGRLDDAAKKYYDTVVQEIRQLQPGELTEEEAAAWGAVAPGIEARLMLGLQTLKWIRGWQPLPCPTAMNDVGEALARTPHAIREVSSFTPQSELLIGAWVGRGKGIRVPLSAMHAMMGGAQSGPWPKSAAAT